MESQIPRRVFCDLCRALVVWTAASRAKESFVSSPCILFLVVFCVSSNLPPVKLQSLVHHLSQVVRSVFHVTVHQSVNPQLSDLPGRILWETWLEAVLLLNNICCCPHAFRSRRHAGQARFALGKAVQVVPATFLVFMGLGLHSRRICSITISVCSFPGPFLSLLVEVWNVACLVPVHLPH